MPEWTNQDDVARVDIAGVDNAAPCGRGAQCRSGQISTIWQGWTLQEWTMQEWSNAFGNVLKTSCKLLTVCEIKLTY